jgi:hypothetical protein
MAKGIQAALGGALAIAAVSTLGDFLWVEWELQNTPRNGVLHGALLFLCVGGYLGALTRKHLTGAAAGALIGGLAAAGYYLIRPVAGRVVMFLLYFGVWIALGFLNQRLAPGKINTGAALGRGLLAAVGSGVAFYLVSGIWFPFDPEGWDYLVHFSAWTVAYLPGFAALLVARQTEA